MHIHQVSKSDYSSAVRTTYLGRVEQSRRNALKAQEQISITDQSITVGTLLDETDCKILLDSGAINIFISKQ